MKVGPFFLQVVTQQRCNGHCPCDCPAQQSKQQLRGTLVATQWRGDTALTLPLFRRRSTASSVSAVEPSLSRPPPPPPAVPVPNKHPCFCGRYAKCLRFQMPDSSYEQRHLRHSGWQTQGFGEQDCPGRRKCGARLCAVHCLQGLE